MNRKKSARIRMRVADSGDIPTLIHWQKQPHVIVALTDDPSEPSIWDWATDLSPENQSTDTFIAEVSSTPIGVVQITDPATDPSNYWGDIPKGLRALDIWIGEPDYLGNGYGSEMMNWAIEWCFSKPTVQAIIIDPLYSNTDAIRFYHRLGFIDVERRQFDETSDCLVMRLDR